MKKIVIFASLWLYVLFGFAQGYSTDYEVISDCDFVRNNKNIQQYTLVLVNAPTESMYITLSPQNSPYDTYPLNAKLLDNGKIVVKPMDLDYLHGYDCTGEGTITENDIQIDCIMTYSEGEEKSCQIKSVGRTAIEILEKQQIFLSSNLVKDILTLTLPTDNNEIKILDLQGKLLLQQNVGQSAEVNVSMLPKGTYVLMVNGVSYRFVKE